MSRHASSAEPPAPVQLDADTLHYCRVLQELIDLGADLALQVHQQATPGRAAEATVAFDRVVRTVRRTVLLAHKLAEPVPVAPRASAARRQIIRAVEDTIQRTAGDDEAEALHEEFLDRLDGPDVEDDIGQRPVAEIIAEICRDLGLATPPGAHPWKRRTPEDVAALCARAASRAPAFHPPAFHPPAFHPPAFHDTVARDPPTRPP